MAGCSTAGIAARLCGDLVLGGFSDWYLPSFSEMVKIYNNRIAIGGFADAYYWTSSEFNAVSASDWGGLGGGTNRNKNITQYVRAIRSF
jgi:hypothetical protein